MDEHGLRLRRFVNAIMNGASTALQSESTQRTERSTALLAVQAVALVTVVRLVALLVADLDLGGDEAQYWWWAQSPDFGYYSKPPLIAWLIALSTSVCGDGEACVRVTSPLLHAATSGILFIVARRLYDDRTGLWSCVTFLTLPGVTFSSGLITTDVPLLFFWSLGLLCFLEALNRRSAAAVGLGVAIGLGMLSKYAMIYFVISAILYCAVTPGARWFLRSREGAVALTLALVVLAPNVWWNFANGFATLGHTVDNAAWSASWFHPDRAVEFLAGQLAVFGPLLFPMLLAMAWSVWRSRKDGTPTGYGERERLLLWFALPVLVLVTAQGLRSRAYANWAAVAYPSASIAVVAWLLTRGRTIWLKASLVLHLVVAAGMYGLALRPEILDGLGLADPMAQVRGWSDLATGVSIAMEEHPGGVLVTDSRMVTAEMLYYLRDQDVTIRIWDENGIPQDHFESTMPLGPEPRGPVLLLTGNPDPPRLRERFERVEGLGPVDKPAGPRRTRTFHLFLMTQPRGVWEPG